MTNTELTHSRGGYGAAEIVTGSAKFGADILGHEGVREDGKRRRFLDLPASVPGSSKGLGFVPRSEGFHRVYNAAIGTFLVLLVLPLLAVISLILLISQGRPIFYRGVRVAQNGGRFGILKFRSLDEEKAKELTKDRVLAPGTGAETRVGMFLRETRLDELPQLLNVMLGDMNLCGPRPVRPEIMEVYKASIPNYEERFKVKPGLIGPTQAMMYHGTSKAIRSRLNNQFCRTEVSYGKEIGLVITVAACVFARTVTKLTSLVSAVLIPNRRNPAMVLADKYDVRFEGEGGRHLMVSAIDKQTLRFEGQADAADLREGRLMMTLPDGRKRSLEIALTPDRVGYAYEPKTEFGRHIISRYLFQQVVVPHQSEFLFARLMPKVSPFKR